MHHLEQSDYSRVASLFSGLAPLHGSVRAVLAGTAEGSVQVDRPRHPTIAVLHGPEGVYLAGELVTPAAASAARSVVNGWDYVIASPELKPHLGAILPHRFMLPHQRVRLSIRPHPGQRPSLPDGYAYAQGDEPLATEIIHDGVVVASCTPDLAVGTYAEIGIRTDPAHRRRGLATAAARATVAAAAAAGLSEVGWHCLASNRGSLAVASAAGLTETHRYEAWAETLPAENAGDLSAEDCRAHAETLSAGVADYCWLGFHVAGAWAQAGETERAVAAIERLVGGGWTGRPEWLEQHWSLAPLRADPRFVAAIAAQRAG
jgi:RimJ/RimL family protein N-acetyltransferase